MYPNVHGITGTLCTLGVYGLTKDLTVSAIAGGILAFASHDLLDRLGEKHYPSTKFLLLFEGSLFTIFCMIAWFSSLTVLYVIGWFSANLMDLIDKKMGLSVYDNIRYPYGQFFKCHRRKPNFNLSFEQTILVGYLSMILIIIFYIIENNG